MKVPKCGGHAQSYHMTIPLLGILAKAVKAGTRGTGSVLVGGALLTMTESWKQPQCPSVDERINRQQTLTQLQTGGAFGHVLPHGGAGGHRVG